MEKTTDERKIYQCQECEYRTGKKSNLTRHLRTHTRKKKDGSEIYQCQECEYYSHRHSNLNRHMKIHNGERPYQCQLCDRAFGFNTLLRNHMNTHTGVKPYNCTEGGCDRAFVTSGELSRHIKYQHTHEKPFKCSLCDYACVEITTLYRHAPTHTGEKPYSCNDCGKAFANNSHLKRHRLTHTGEKPYECTECKQRFTKLDSLKMHVTKQHLKITPTKFACEFCRSQFSRKYDLKVHIKRKHATEHCALPVKNHITDVKDENIESQSATKMFQETKGSSSAIYAVKDKYSGKDKKVLMFDGDACGDSEVTALISESGENVYVV